jgi:dUTP pyrophosphatase
MGGVIDSDFRGNVTVMLFKYSDEDYKIEKHDRIAQLILEKIATPKVAVIDETLGKYCSCLFDTERGEKGFGSTGN